MTEPEWMKNDRLRSSKTRALHRGNDTLICKVDAEGLVRIDWSLLTRLLGEAGWR